MSHEMKASTGGRSEGDESESPKSHTTTTKDGAYWPFASFSKSTRIVIPY